LQQCEVFLVRAAGRGASITPPGWEPGVSLVVSGHFDLYFFRLLFTYPYSRRILFLGCFCHGHVSAFVASISIIVVTTHYFHVNPLYILNRGSDELTTWPLSKDGQSRGVAAHAALLRQRQGAARFHYAYPTVDQLRRLHILVLLVILSLQVSSRDQGTNFTLSLREVAECTGRGLPNAKSRQWGTKWPRE
jgi:hypothetical protein